MASKLSVGTFCVSVCLLMAGAAPAYAQIDDSPWIRPQGYVVGALGGSSTSSGTVFGAAAGGGVRFGPYLDAGVEAGAYACLILSVSADARVRIVTRRPGQRLVPFISGGYSYLNLITGDTSGPNVGGGVEYELNPRRALHIEFRDVIKRRGTRSPSNYWFIRTGITFR